MAKTSNPHREQVVQLCRLIEQAEQAPRLQELAKHATMSPFHLQRVFKSVTGLTPKQYAAAHRAERVRKELRRQPSVTEAIYQAGFNSSGRFYENTNRLLGMTPSNYKAGGINTEIHFAVGESSLGSILVAASSKGVCAIFLGDNPEPLVRELQRRFPGARLVGGDAQFERVVAQVVGFVETPKKGFDLPLDIRGTAFQQRVWQALRKIPLGKTATYTDIARAIGHPNAVRGVAQACASNHIALAIPCHRVIRKGGELAGYRWGIERKRSLLLKESSIHLF